MNNPSIEITENQYCIKLNKDLFNLSLVRQLIKRIETQKLTTNSNHQIFEDDIISKNSSNYYEIFDRLEDK